MNKNSYAGREYLSALKKAKIKVDVLLIGKFNSRNLIEEERCAGLWKPVPFILLKDFFNVFSFSSLKTEKFLNFIENQKYDLGIQGGTGILSEKIFSKFSLGILNFHPGKLPLYRGCSAPEWQLFEKKDIIATCHLIDSKIDTGPIISFKTLDPDMRDYYHFRSTIYPEISIFLVEQIKKIIRSNGFTKNPKIQDESKAIYREYIGSEKIEYLKKIFK